MSYSDFTLNTVRVSVYGKVCLWNFPQNNTRDVCTVCSLSVVYNVNIHIVCLTNTVLCLKSSHLILYG